LAGATAPPPATTPGNWLILHGCKNIRGIKRSWGRAIVPIAGHGVACSASSQPAQPRPTWVVRILIAEAARMTRNSSWRLASLAAAESTATAIYHRRRPTDGRTDVMQYAGRPAAVSAQWNSGLTATTLPRNHLIDHR